MCPTWYNGRKPKKTRLFSKVPIFNSDVCPRYFCLWSSLMADEIHEYLQSYQYSRSRNAFGHIPDSNPFGVLYPPYPEWYLQPDSQNSQEIKEPAKEVKTCQNDVATAPKGRSRRHAKVDLRNAEFCVEEKSFLNEQRQPLFRIIRGSITDRKSANPSVATPMQDTSSSSQLPPSGLQVQQAPSRPSMSKLIQSMTPSELSELSDLLATHNTQRSTTTTL